MYRDGSKLYHDIGSHLSLRRVKVLAAQLRPTLCDCSPPGSSVYGILQARILEVEG